MKRSVLPVLLLAFLLAAMSTVGYADPANDDKVNPSDIVEMLEQQKSEELQQKEQKLNQLWTDVKESVARKDYKTATAKLEEILKLNENSEDAKRILAMLNQTPTGEPKAGDRNSLSDGVRWVRS